MGGRGGGEGVRSSSMVIFICSVVWRNKATKEVNEYILQSLANLVGRNCACEPNSILFLEHKLVS
jgi:hypothetical protein